MDYLKVERERQAADPNFKFILTYKAAIKSELSREQLASYLGMIPDSLMRKRLKIFERTGVDLKPLELNGESDIPADLMDQFEENIELLERSSIPERIDSYENNKRYVITSAQNATAVNEKFLNALLNYCNRRDAELLIIPNRYKNPTSIWSENNKANEWWHPSIAPYIQDYSRKLGKSLEYLGHIKIQPTAINPLVGFESYTGVDSGVFGHPKIEQRCIPTPSQNLPKILTTTGSITYPNFTDSKAGHKGAFHHSFAAIVAEIDNSGHHHIRHIHWNEELNGFYDFESFYGPIKYTTGHRILGLVTGDSHAEFLSPEVEAATYFNDDSMVNVLRPVNLVKHDVDDFYRRNHHHQGDDVLAYAKHHFGRNNVERGLQITADYLDRTSRPDMQTIVIRANHDEAFDRWLRECNPKIDPENAKFYYYMKYNQLDNVERTRTGFKTFDAFPWWCFNPCDQPGLKHTDRIKFKERDQSEMIADIEVGFHGDQGSNGTSGNITGFSKIGPKVIIGHSHTPGIKEGAYQVGISAYKDLEYQSGPSSWMHTHCIIYPDGSRTLIHIVDGEYRGNF
jgi:hypothetical protein